MTNKEFFKNLKNKKIKSKKSIDGYYSDKTGFHTLYKDKNGNINKKRRKR